ncbi:unnamed protein product [Arabis nemorensis]|uniref:Jacalin-type lectin domain-containing protein n=1 Tax=Arabis nemorensis TaxID=586526 RepID=A0A565BRJ4_9BRAS|nr:unnamed protein product [Arabis nemorensis]
MGLNYQETMTQRVGPFGVNMGGELFDDNCYHGVRSVKVGFQDGHLVYMEINYVRNGNMEMEQVSHGVMPSSTFQFVVAHFPKEFITAVEGTSAFWPRSVTNVTGSFRLHIASGLSRMKG